MFTVKRSLSFILLAILALCFTFIYPVSTANAERIISPAIKNGSFETTTLNDYYEEVPKYWTITSSAPNYYYNYVLENAYDGDRYYNFTRYNGEYVLSSDRAINVDCDTDYLFGIKFISDSILANISITLDCYDQNGQNVKTVQSEPTHITKTNEWSDAHVRLVADNSVYSVRIKFTIRADGGNVGVDYAYSSVNAVTTNVGASIRLDKTAPGIRFTGKVDKAIYDQMISTYQNVSVGILIIPKDYLCDLGEFTFKAILSSGKTYLDIPALMWNNPLTIQKDGYYGYSCAMVDVKETNIRREFCAISYLKYTDNGIENVIYSEYEQSSHCRSIYSVANKLMEYIDYYETVEQQIIEAYANGVRPE